MQIHDPGKPMLNRIGRTQMGNNIVEISPELHGNLELLAHALIGSFDRPAPNPEVDRWSQAVQALHTFLAEVVREIGYGGPAQTMPAMTITKVIKPGHIVPGEVADNPIIPVVTVITGDEKEYAYLYKGTDTRRMGRLELQEALENMGHLYQDLLRRQGAR